MEAFINFMWHDHDDVTLQIYSGVTTLDTPWIHKELLTHALLC